jgi:hypothetical protein
MRWAIVCCLAGASLLAGCGRHEAAQADGAAPEATPAAGLPLFGRPHLRAGLWRTSVTTNVGPGLSMTGELCLDASNEDAAFSSNGHGFSKDCDPVQYQTAPGGFGFNTVCHLGKRTVTTSGTANGDFKTAYTVALTTRMDPAPSGLPNQMTTSIRARWEGPCPAGTKPGGSMRLAGFGQG